MPWEAAEYSFGTPRATPRWPVRDDVIGRIDPGRHGSERAPCCVRRSAPPDPPECMNRLIAPALTIALVGGIPPWLRPIGICRGPVGPEAPARFGTVAYSRGTPRKPRSSRYGWNRKQFVALKKLWFRESSWNYKAVNRSSGLGNPAVAAGFEDAQPRQGLPHQPGDPDRLGPGLHQGPLWLAGQGVSFWKRHHWY